LADVPAPDAEQALKVAKGKARKLNGRRSITNCSLSRRAQRPDELPEAPAALVMQLAGRPSTGPHVMRQYAQPSNACAL
jgi:hypothetical protein